MILVENPSPKPMPTHRYSHLVGIDVAKHTLDVMLWCCDQDPPSKRTFHISNDAAGHRQLIQQMEALVDSDQRLRGRYEQLKGIDGIGEKTALMWLCLF